MLTSLKLLTCTMILIPAHTHHPDQWRTVWVIGAQKGLQFCHPKSREMPDTLVSGNLGMRASARAQGNKNFTTAMLLITLPFL